MALPCTRERKRETVCVHVCVCVYVFMCVRVCSCVFVCGSGSGDTAARQWVMAAAVTLGDGAAGWRRVLSKVVNVNVRCNVRIGLTRHEASR